MRVMLVGLHAKKANAQTAHLVFADTQAKC
jgi:hypothetical protein